MFFNRQNFGRERESGQYGSKQNETMRASSSSFSVGPKPVTTNNPINRIRTIPDFLIRASRNTCPLHLSFNHNISIISYLQRRNSRTNLLELSPFNLRALQMSYIIAVVKDPTLPESHSLVVYTPYHHRHYCQKPIINCL